MEPTGSIVARALHGVWRVMPPPLDLTVSELDRIEPHLRFSREAGMVWARAPGAPEVERLRDAARWIAIDNAHVEAVLATQVRRLQQAGIDPIVVKGWAASRYYARRGIRPYGDIDLCVLPRDFATACSIVGSIRDPHVDLHYGFTNAQGQWLLPDPPEDVFSRARHVPLGAGTVRVLADEDHLRLICMHALQNAAIRPLWLCDVAAALESLSPDFDWDFCLDDRCEWVAIGIALACEMLGAVPPASLPSYALPAWIAPAVEQLWGDYREPDSCNWLQRPPAWYDHQRLTWRGRLNPMRAVRLWHGPLRDLPHLWACIVLLLDTLQHIARYVSWRAARGLDQSLHHVADAMERAGGMEIAPVAISQDEVGVVRVRAQQL